MVVSNPSITSLVIQGYLNGKSRDQIAKELGISTGTVSKIIKEWKLRLGIPIAEELRDFAILVKKSDIPIEQCAEGYRMKNIMKNLGIFDDIDDENVVDSIGNGIGNSDDNRRIRYNEFSFFVKEIYMNCKRLGIKPIIISSWIHDLFSWYSPYVNLGSSVNGKRIDGEEKRNDKKPAVSSPPLKTPYLSQEAKPMPVSNSDEFIINQSSNAFTNNITADLNPKQNTGSLNNIESPFVSQISNYIAKKKKECRELENYKWKLEKDIKIKESKKNQKEFELELLKQDKKYVMTFIDWFYDLKRELWERFTIKIEDFGTFTSVINDFKKNGFDIAKIMEKYISAISLDDKIKKESDELQILHSQKIESNKTLALWQDQVNQHQHTMDIYYQLEDMNLGLKELKQLVYLILEVSKANNISPDRAVLKFLDDIEKDYDNKLGFETKLKEKQDELAFLNNKVINCRTILQSQSSIGAAFSNLLQKGITESDIITINQLVEVCTKSNNIDFSNSKIGIQNEDFITKYKNTNDSKVKSEYWKMWINDLKRYGDIKVTVQEYQVNAEKLQKQVYNLDKQKQESTNYIQTAISFINSLNNEISYYKGFIDQIKDQKNKINLASRVSLLPIFILVNKNSEKDEEKDEENN